MSGMEFLVLAASIVTTVWFLGAWYRPLATAWPPERGRGARWGLGLLPVAALVIVFCTLRFLASFDVVGDFIFILFYLVLGYAWLALGVLLMAAIFDLSWLDDALLGDNRAALVAVAGGFVGLTLIYAGANVGDGPGWWCVVFAGGLGLAAWLVLGVLLHLCTGVFERVTVGRSVGSGIRLGFYLLSSGILLARACAGDWTSFSMTVIEFLDGWPVLVLTGAAILVELILARTERETGRGQTLASLVVGLLFLALSVLSVLWMPQLRQNPLYGAAGPLLWGGLL